MESRCFCPSPVSLTYTHIYDEIITTSCYHGDNDDDKKDDDDDELDGELMDLEDDLDFYLHGRQISQEYNELKQILTRNREIDDASSHGIMMDGRNHVQYPSHSSPSQHLMGAGGLAGIHSQRVHDPSILEYIQQEYGGGIKPDINNSNLSFRSTHESNTTVKYPQQPPLFMMSRPLQVDSFTATSSTDSNYPSPKDMINDHILDADDVLDVPTQPQPSLKKPSKFKQFMSENSSIPSSPSFYSGSGSGSPSSSAEENYFNISASSDSLSSVSKCVSFCPTVKTNDGNNSTSSNNNSFASRNVKSSSSGYGGTSTAVKIEVVERPSMYPIVSSMSSSTSSFSASSSKKQSIFKAALLERTNSNIISK